MWPKECLEPLVTIHPWSLESIGAIAVGNTLNSLRGTGSAVWPVANQALFIPFTLFKRITVTYLFCQNGAAVNGNIDVGLYDIGGNLIISSGSTGQAGTLQQFNIADTDIGPGVFYLAASMDNVIGTTRRGVAFANIFPAIAGMAEMANAFPLPNPAVMVQITGNYVPLIGLVCAPRGAL